MSIGIRRPEEFETEFEFLKAQKIADRFVEIVVLAAYVGFSKGRFEKGGKLHKPVEWQYFQPQEKHRMYILALAHTMLGGNQADPGILHGNRRAEMFAILEQYVHGGLLVLREEKIFQTLERDSVGNLLATFVREGLREPAEAEISDDPQPTTQDLIKDLLGDLDARVEQYKMFEP